MDATAGADCLRLPFCVAFADISISGPFYCAELAPKLLGELESERRRKKSVNTGQ